MRLIDADELSEKLCKTTVFVKDGEVFQRMVNDAPTVSAEAVDCSEFILWILDEIMDEENWECNAVANGEIIARKLKKLGVLEVKDGYYVRTPSADAVQGEWVQEDEYGDLWVCDQCGLASEYMDNFCPNCGAKMFREDDEG